MSPPARRRSRIAVTTTLAALGLLLAALPTAAQEPTAEGLPPRYVVTYAEPLAGPQDAQDPQVQADRAAAQEQRGSDRAAERRADQAAARVGADADLVARTDADAAVIAIDRALTAEQQAALEAELAAIPGVVLVEEDRLLSPQQAGDPLLAQQWHYDEPVGGIGLSAALATSDGSGARVAVLDTGITAHPDLDAQVVGGYDMIADAFVARDGGGRDADFRDPGDWTTAGECGFGSRASGSSWHGTHVAGTVAAVQGNGEGGIGVAPQADLVVVRVLGRCGGYTTDIAAGIIWAAGGSVAGVPANPNPVDVINMSLGGGGSCDSTTQSAINTARSLGAAVVVAAGNSAANAANYSPASCDGVITVAATQRDGSRASYSNFGSAVELAAPGGGTGGGVLSTLDSGSTTPAGATYAAYNGTSMATPHVAGVAALLRSADPSLTPDQLADALIASARPFPASCSGCGAGILDAPGALAAVTGGGIPDPDPDPEPEPGTYTFTGPLAIPDRGTVSPGIAVDLAGPAPADLLVAVDISHTWRGDLVIDLVAPNGASVNLKSASSRDSADDVRQSWTVDASSVAAGGTWTLRVRDAYRGDVGTINSWSLTF